MGFRFYRSVRLGRGLRLNLSKTGVGVSAGVPGLRYSIHSSGRTVRTAGLPGTGLYYRKDSSVGRSGRSGRSARAALRMPASPRVQMHPKASLFARKEDKLFVRGVTAYMQGRHEDALAALREVIGRDPANAHVGEEVFAGMALVELGRNADAIPMLEAVVASDQQIPDALMTKYRLSGQMVVAVTPAVTATVPMSHVSAALMLAELYQRAGRPQAAVELLESLGSLAPDPVFALSLAELYAAMERPDDVLRVTEGFVQNRDDATAQLLVYRAEALRARGMAEGALAMLKEALRSRSRNPLILRTARYLRGLVHDDAGHKARARTEWERIFAEDPGFADVAARLDPKPPPR